VVPNKDPGGDDAIAAFVVAGGSAPDAATLVSDLQKTLIATLPQYLVPSSIAVRDSLPRSTGGARRRHALQSSQGRAHRDTTHQQQPSGEIEERLAPLWLRCWPEVGGGRRQFFRTWRPFLVGRAHVAQVEREFGRRIKLATLFLAPTLHEFAKVLGRRICANLIFAKWSDSASWLEAPLIVINNTGIYYGLAKNLGPEQRCIRCSCSIRRSEIPSCPIRWRKSPRVRGAHPARASLRAPTT